MRLAGTRVASGTTCHGKALGLDVSVQCESRNQPVKHLCRLRQIGEGARPLRAWEALVHHRVAFEALGHDVEEQVSSHHAADTI